MHRPLVASVLVASVLAAALVVSVPAALHAQVGALPANSPYRDLEYKQELSAFTGFFAAGEDPAGVAPQSGPMVGARYDVRIGGPAHFTARLATVFSERRVLDPARAPDGGRDLGVREQALYVGDVGLTVNLTGQKSWNRLVPYLQGGVGAATDFRGRDIGAFRFGTTFAFNFGAGVRWVPDTRWQLRADVGDWLYRVEYPQTYFVPTAAGSASGTNDAVLAATQSTSVWTHNLALTVGASYRFYR